jgi:hypothetical protein
MLVLYTIAGTVISFWPARYRSWYATDFELYPAAALAGLAQYLACLGVLFVRYVHLMQRTLERMGGAALANSRVEALALPSAQYGMGFAALAEFISHPLSLLLIYLTLEGLVRFTAAAVTHEVLCTMPIYLLGRGYERFERLLAHQSRAPRVASQRADLSDLWSCLHRHQGIV